MLAENQDPATSLLNTIPDENIPVMEAMTLLINAYI